MSSKKKLSLIRRFRKFELELSETLKVTEYLLLRILLFLGFMYGIYELLRQIGR